MPLHNFSNTFFFFLAINSVPANFRNNDGKINHGSLSLFPTSSPAIFRNPYQSLLTNQVKERKREKKKKSRCSDAKFFWAHFPQKYKRGAFPFASKFSIRGTQSRVGTFRQKSSGERTGARDIKMALNPEFPPRK